MKIKQITHSDGSISFAEEGITIIKNKEDKTKQEVIGVEVKSIKEAIDKIRSV